MMRTALTAASILPTLPGRGGSSSPAKSLASLLKQALATSKRHNTPEVIAAIAQQARLKARYFELFGVGWLGDFQDHFSDYSWLDRFEAWIEAREYVVTESG